MTGPRNLRLRKVGCCFLMQQEPENLTVTKIVVNMALVLDWYLEPRGIFEVYRDLDLAGGFFANR